MRLALTMVLLLLNPLLLKADDLPRTFFPGILLDEPMPTRFETGQALSLSGSVEDPGISAIVFTFQRADEAGFAFQVWVVEGRFVREVVFPHSLDGEFSLVVEAFKGEETLSLLGRFDGLQIDRGRGPVMLPRRYFPLVHLDQPLPTSLTTGEPLHLAGELEGLASPATLVFRFVSATGPHWDFYFLVEEGRFERTILLPREAEETFALVQYLGLRGGDLAPMAGYAFLDVAPGDEPSEVPRLFFDGLILEEPLPVQWPLGRPVVLAGAVRPFVHRFRLILEPVNGGESRELFPGLEEGRFEYPVRLKAGELGPVRLTVGLEKDDPVGDPDHTLLSAGTFVIEGVDPPAADLEVGVLSVALLAGQEAEVPLFNRGDERVELEAPRIEGPFSVEAYPSVLEPGEAGEIVLSYQGQGDDQGLLSVLSDDPFRPRVAIALSGLERRPASSDLVHLRADSEGRLQAGLDLREQDVVLALYASPLDTPDPEALYDILLDRNGVSAKSAHAPADDRPDTAENGDRRLEQDLARRLGQSGPWAGKPVGVQYEVGDRRSFFFNVDVDTLDQFIETRVAAVNERAVAFLQEDLREDEDYIDEERIRTIIDQFAEDYPVLVDAFGAPSDVDGDGKIALLFTHLMHDIGRPVAFNAGAVVPDHLGGNPRFNYRLTSLQTPEGRGFPPPASVTYRLDGEPPGLTVKPWGLQFLRVTGDGTASLGLQTEPHARLGAVALPVARAAAPTTMAADHFAGITFDPPLPLELATGQPLVLQGTTADSVDLIHVEFYREDGGRSEEFFLLVDEGRFSRTIYFLHEQAATYSLNVYVEKRKPTPFAGRFFPIRLTRGHGPLQVPTRYFNRVRLDRPLPTSVGAHPPLRIAGEVSDPEATLMQWILRPLAEGTTSFWVLTWAVEAGRFDGELPLTQVPSGRYRLELHLGPAGDLTYVGAVTSFEIRPVATALELAAEPPAFALHPNYPNPLQQPHPALLLLAGGPAVGGAGGVRLAGSEAGGPGPGAVRVGDPRGGVERPRRCGAAPGQRLVLVPPAGGAVPGGGQAVAAAVKGPRPIGVGDVSPPCYDLQGRQNGTLRNNHRV